jgi:hypothetical protein
MVPLSPAEGHGTLWRVLEGVFSKRDHEFESSQQRASAPCAAVIATASRPDAPDAGPVEFFCLNPFQNAKIWRNWRDSWEVFAKSGVNPGSGYQGKSMD